MLPKHLNGPVECFVGDKAFWTSSGTLRTLSYHRVRNSLYCQLRVSYSARRNNLRPNKHRRRHDPGRRPSIGIDLLPGILECGVLNERRSRSQCFVGEKPFGRPRARSEMINYCRGTKFLHRSRRYRTLYRTRKYVMLQDRETQETSWIDSKEKQHSSRAEPPA